MMNRDEAYLRRITQAASTRRTVRGLRQRPMADPASNKGPVRSRRPMGGVVQRLHMPLFDSLSQQVLGFLALTRYHILAASGGS